MLNASVAKLNQVRELLGEPAHASEHHLLYVGDCQELLRQLPREVIDLSITSPPYNIGKEYETVREMDAYLEWCGEWMSQLHRVSAPTGAFWLNVGYVSLANRAKAIPLPYLLWDRCPFFLNQEIVWNYGAGVAARRSFSPRNEKFLWFVKNAESYTFNLDAVRDPNVKYPNQKKNGKLRCNPFGKNPSDVWQFPKVTSGTDRSSPERTKHPAQFPVAVIDRIVKASSAHGAMILDPFVGSGTTIEAAIANGRVAIGFELREDYAQIAASRIDRWLSRAKMDAAQLALFPA